MKFIPTKLQGAYLIHIEAIHDERGFFARSWCEQEFIEQGLNPCIKQCNISFNNKKGMLRGMHYQAEPYAEVKLVRCTRGSIYDVIIDLRQESDTYKQYYGVELSDTNHSMLYVPDGFAHGFQTLEDNAEVLYYMSHHYVAEAAMGVRWDDPAFAIEWPEETQRVMSSRDAQYADFISSIDS